jgi:hypothetical protein
MKNNFNEEKIEIHATRLIAFSGIEYKYYLCNKKEWHLKIDLYHYRTDKINRTIFDRNLKEHETELTINYLNEFNFSSGIKVVERPDVKMYDGENGHISISFNDVDEVYDWSARDDLVGVYELYRLFDDIKCSSSDLT